MTHNINMEQKGCLTSVLLDVTSILLVYLPWIVLQTVQPFKRGFFCNDESLKYPYKESTIPGSVATALGLIIPIVVVLLMEGFYVYLQRKNNIQPKMFKVAQYKIHPYFYICYRIIGIFLFGAAVQQTITNIGKYCAGRLRPHFFYICQPDYSLFNCTNAEGMYRYITEDVCTNTDAHRLKEMRLSFPSGHSSLTSYCMTYLVLYLQHRFVWKGSELLRPFCQVIALWLSLATCTSRISDYKHHWSDVFFGVVIGVTMALIAGIFIARFFKNGEVLFLQKQLDAMLEKSQNSELIPKKYQSNEPTSIGTVILEDSSGETL